MHQYLCIYLLYTWYWYVNLFICHWYVTFSTFSSTSCVAHLAHRVPIPLSGVSCLMPACRNFGTLPRQVTIFLEPKCGVILTLYLTYSCKSVVTFEPIEQFWRSSRFRIYNKCEKWSISQHKAPSLRMRAWRRRKVIFTKDLSVN